MTWSTPRVWTTAEIMTASKLNVFVSDDLLDIYNNRFDPNNFDYDFLIARSTANLNLTTYRQDVPGCSITLDRVGTWLIFGIFHAYLDWSDSEVFGELAVATVWQTPVARSNLGQTTGGTIALKKRYVAASQPLTAKLGGYYQTGGSGGSFLATNTAIAALCLKVPS